MILAEVIDFGWQTKECFLQCSLEAASILGVSFIIGCTILGASKRK